MSGVARAQRRRTPTERRAARAAVDDPAVVLEAAAIFLAARPRSVAETRRRLREQGYRDELIELVLSRLLEFGYLDDEAFGRAWLESRDRAHPRGEAALRRELAQKGIERETIARLLRERAARRAEDVSAGGGEAGSGPAPAPDLQAARNLLARRWRSLSRDADLRRRRAHAYALLARNGFDPEVIGEALAGVESDDLDDRPPDP